MEKIDYDYDYDYLFDYQSIIFYCFLNKKKIKRRGLGIMYFAKLVLLKLNEILMD